MSLLFSRRRHFHSRWGSHLSHHCWNRFDLSKSSWHNLSLHHCFFLYCFYHCSKVLQTRILHMGKWCLHWYFLLTWGWQFCKLSLLLWCQFCCLSKSDIDKTKSKYCCISKFHIYQIFRFWNLLIFIISKVHFNFLITPLFGQNINGLVYR